VVLRSAAPVAGAASMLGLTPRYGSAPRLPPLCSPPGGKGSPREVTAAPLPRRGAARVRSACPCPRDEAEGQGQAPLRFMRYAVAVARLRPEAVLRCGLCAPAPRLRRGAATKMTISENIDISIFIDDQGMG